MACRTFRMWIQFLPRLSCALLGALWGFPAIPAQAQIASSAPQSRPASLVPLMSALALADDARLNVPVSVQATGIELRDLLKQVSHAPLTLTADRFCAGQKIQLSLHPRPLRQLMYALAELLPGTWRTLDDKSGYILRMSPAAVQRREKWWRIFEQEREQEIAALRAAALAAMRTPPYRRKPGEPDSEHTNPEIEAQIAAEHSFFNVLSPEQQERIANSLNDIPLNSGSSDMGFGEEEAVQVAFTDLPPAAQEMLRKDPGNSLFASRRNADWNMVTVRFDNTGSNVASSIALPNGEASMGQALRVPFEQSPALGIDHRSLAYTAHLLERAAPKTLKRWPETWKQLLAYQNSRVWPNDAPLHPPRQSPPHRSDALRRISAQADIEFVADYYSKPGLPIQLDFDYAATEVKALIAAPTLKTTLDDAAALHDMSWKRETGGLYLFRDNRWYRDDLLEVPDTLAKRWMAEQAAPDAEQRRRAWKTEWTPQAIRAQMDWEADVVSHLTLWQIGIGLHWTANEDYLATLQMFASHEDWGSHFVRTYPFNRETTRILGEYHTTLFYAGLSSEQRDAILANRLLFTSLTPALQQQAAALSPRLRALLASGAAPVLLGLDSNIGKEPTDPNNMPRVRLTAAVVSP